MERRHNRYRNLWLRFVFIVVVSLASAQSVPPTTQAPGIALVGTSVAAAGIAQNGTCSNPLFKVHWSGKSDIVTLLSAPKVQQDLRLCKSYLNRPSCCPVPFEDVLSKAFDRWVRHWKTKSQNLQDVQAELAKVKASQTYIGANPLQRALFDKAVESFAQVLEWYGTCFNTLLAYIAGMLCFTCDPDWKSKVFLSSGGVSVGHLHVDDNSNELVWQSCRGLGSAAAEMQTRLVDSLLVKNIKLPFQDFSMFRNKISASQYMSRLGLSPLRGPRENELVKNPGGGSMRIRRLTDSGQGSQTPSGFVDPVRDGRSSTFSCSVFPGRPIGFNGSPQRRLAPLFLVVVWSQLAVNLWRPRA